MSTYRLDKIFAPQSIALVGVGSRAGSVGRIILRNLREAGFAGSIQIVHPRETAIDGVGCVARISDLAAPVDLVVISAPPQAVAELIAEAGPKGCGAVIVVTAGMGHGEGSLGEAARLAARGSGLRLVGPNCLGVIAPAARLNASFAARTPPLGDLALVSQSGAIAAGVVQWAAARNVGFSAVVTLGDKLDVDFGDCLDYFAADDKTHAILLYIESINDPRKFLSAARAATRVKPVIVMKAGRRATGMKAAATHTGALAGSDAVYDAAFRRAGLLRASSLREFFSAAETLSHVKPFAGDQLAVLTNGGGLGVLAMDQLDDLGLPAAQLSDETIRRLDALLPATWSRANPVDIAGDAGPDRYSDSLNALLDDPNVDAVLVLQVPTALAGSADCARAVAKAMAERKRSGSPAKPLFASWIGGDRLIHDIFEAAGAPSFSTEFEAIGGYSNVVRYSRAQRALLETPPGLRQEFAPDSRTAREVAAQACAENRRWLDPMEVNRLLQAYGIPVTPISFAANAAAAALAARPILASGERVVVKILSPDVIHKSDVGGVAIDLDSEAAVAATVEAMFERVHARRPAARIAGVIVQPMIRRPNARELIIGMADDATFGPVMAFGSGGTSVELVDDKALGLPPLDMRLAKELIGRTRVSRLLDAYRDVQGADTEAVAATLVKLSQLVADIGEVREIDLNPVLADATGVIVLDARIAVAPLSPDANSRVGGNARLAIRPYPRDWEREFTLNDGDRVHVRPVRPEDEMLIQTMLRQTSPADLRLRFFGAMREFTHAFLARLTQLDYARSMAFVALAEGTNEALGVVRLVADANHEAGEFAILVRTDRKGVGLGWRLMQLMIDWGKADGLQTIKGQVLADNAVMLALCDKLGFAPRIDEDSGDVRTVTLSV